MSDSALHTTSKRRVQAVPSLVVSSRYDRRVGLVVGYPVDMCQVGFEYRSFPKWVAMKDLV
jgi:hypothetical protein